eukprot:4813093-Pleurochrysis_carterae.AAC.2
MCNAMCNRTSEMRRKAAHARGAFAASFGSAASHLMLIVTSDALADTNVVPPLRQMRADALVLLPPSPVEREKHGRKRECACAVRAVRAYAGVGANVRVRLPSPDVVQAGMRVDALLR